MRKFADKYPNLIYLLNGYFYQCWYDEFDSFESAISSFLQKEPKEKSLALADELGCILALNLNDEEYDILLSSSGCDYYVWRIKDSGVSEWLFLLANQFYEHAYS